MFLSKEVIVEAFKGLKKIFPKDEGKSRQERVSAIKYFIATSKLIDANSGLPLNLKPDAGNRAGFIEEVGRIVRLDDQGHHTKNFSDLFGLESDFGVGSNFLTTRLKDSRGRKTAYPGRPASLLELNDELVSVAPGASQTLLNDFNLKSVQVELSLWLLRFSKLNLANSETSLDDLIKEIGIRISQEYGTFVANIILPKPAQFQTFFSSIKGALLENSAPDLSILVTAAEEKSTEDSQKNELVLLNDDDPYLSSVKAAINQKGECNFLFFGAPGTGKTWYASKIALTLAGGDENKVKFLQFHPSVSYDDFIEGFVPRIDPLTKAVTYEIQKKHFVQFARLAAANPEEDYFLVIDEISRGDPARVFGELLTYIEPSYRGKPFSLIYSQELFEVPENLIIIATANPYDRSITELDDAFLRRFYMVEFESDKEVLNKRLIENTISEKDGNRILHFFETIDENMPYGFGHAQFFNVFSIDDVVLLWNSKLRFIIKRSLQFETDKFDVIEGKFNSLFSEGLTEAGNAPIEVGITEQV